MRKLLQRLGLSTWESLVWLKRSQGFAWGLAVGLLIGLLLLAW
jgi:hypothetical protein